MNIKFKNTYKGFFTVLLSLVACLQVYAGEILFGPEFTFTNQTLINAGKLAGDSVVNTVANQKGRDDWAEVVRADCPECILEDKIDQFGAKYYQVSHSPSGFWFNISLDPWVVENQVKPMTISEVRNNQNLIQNLIFDSAKKAGLEPHQRIGGGHLHLDLKSAFGDDAKLFRNFLVDFQNHPRLSMGAFGVIPDNAPTLAILDQGQRANFKGLLSKVDNNPADFNIERIAQELTDSVYYKTFMNWKPVHKYQNLNVSRIIGSHIKDHERTLEVRGLRPQKNVADYIKFMEIFSARLKMLKSSQNIPYQEKVMEVDPQNLRKIDSEQKVVDEFYDYVTGAGLDYYDYTDMLPNNLAWLVPSQMGAIECQDYQGSNKNNFIPIPENVLNSPHLNLGL